MAATTERIVTDWHTGIALYGYDPVAYFTEARPTTGRSEFELRHAGVTWRFRNEGNRAAFAADPGIYMPQFGGYDPIGVARGVATPGHPQFWARVENRVYLFAGEAQREAFVANPERAISAAESRWPEVLKKLVQ